ncbi:DUF305 domain-containing protein [Amycolatopsis vancoresmycina]|uniref:DUF305 domain-containing protein n=1 Tax=Amycolatopsis vancoresmycina DSM 44592 TaxID=1292037 RepID=R1HUS2_9PSEU|nr:DUF305 domain-containing protein [Amycolatopsis vancoresmycina]EOD64101.1 hypothetical protein H480_33565 [Amycolatopsis vancoresmycina DSM 44592]
MRRRILGAAVVALIMGGCATTAGPAATGPAATPFNPTDVAWLQLVVPMSENALTAARLAPEHTASPAVRSAAAAFAGPQERLLVRLRATRDRAGLPAADIHSGHRMPGMVTAADLVALRSDRGAGFDRRLVALLRAHATQLVVLAGGEQTSGQDAETRALARETGTEGTHASELLAKAA